MKKIICLVLMLLSLTSCLSLYRNFNSNSVNDGFRDDGYYTSIKTFTIFDKSTTSYTYIKFLDKTNKRLLFSHSKFPIAPSGKIRQGSTFKTTYQLKYNSDENLATLSFIKTISSFASYTGRLRMEVNIKVSDKSHLEGFVFKSKQINKPNKKTKIPINRRKK